MLALYSGPRVELNEFCTEPVLTSLEGLPMSKVLLVLAVCFFEMKLTISERVQAQGYPVALLGNTTSALGLSTSQIAMRWVVFVA